MPTYTYRCTKCGTEYEAFQSMSDPPLRRCKKCRGALRRTFHPVGIVLKGSGFYKTDHRSKAWKASSSDSSKDSERKSEAPAKSESKSDAKGDSKGDAKGDSKGDSKGSKSESKGSKSTDSKGSSSK